MSFRNFEAKLLYHAWGALQTCKSDCYEHLAGTSVSMQREEIPQEKSPYGFKTLKRIPFCFCSQWNIAKTKRRSTANVCLGNVNYIHCTWFE